MTKNYNLKTQNIRKTILYGFFKKQIPNINHILTLFIVILHIKVNVVSLYLPELFSQTLLYL